MAIACSTSAFKTDFDTALGQVRELGFSHADLICIPQWGHVSLPALVEDYDSEAGRVRSLLETHEITPVGLNCGLPATYDRSEQSRNDRLAQVRAAARLMNQLDVKVASFYPGYKVEDRPWSEVMRDAATSMREMIEIGDQADVTFAIELHAHTPFETVEQCTALLEEVPQLKVAYDPSHFALQQIPLAQTAPFLQRSVHVHIRDAGPDKMQMPFGQGTVDLAWLIRTLKSCHYQGHYSIEYLPNLPEPVGQSITRTRDAIAELLEGEQA
jgi:sugar phosphate isomerase/epimerase